MTLLLRGGVSAVTRKCLHKSVRQMSAIRVRAVKATAIEQELRRESGRVEQELRPLPGLERRFRAVRQSDVRVINRMLANGPGVAVAREQVGSTAGTRCLAAADIVGVLVVAHDVEVATPVLPSRRRDCHLMAPPYTCIRCFNCDKQGCQ